MNFFVTGSTQSDKAIKVLKFLSNNLNTIYLISLVMHFQRIACSANPALMPIP